MHRSTRPFLALLLPLILIVAACDASTGAASDAASTDQASASASPTTNSSGTGTGTVGDPMSWFVDGALTTDATTVACTLENGTETTCYQVEVASLASTVDTDGPYCPATVDEVGGIWV